MEMRKDRVVPSKLASAVTDADEGAAAGPVLYFEVLWLKGKTHTVLAYVGSWNKKYFTLEVIQ